MTTAQTKSGSVGGHRAATQEPTEKPRVNYSSNGEAWMPSRCTFTTACLAGLSIGLAIAVVIPPSGGLLA